MEENLMKTCIAVVAALVIAAGALPAKATDLRLLSAWDTSNAPAWLMVTNYVKLVSKLSAGKINIKISGPQVVPPFEQLQPASSGVFDMLFQHGVYHAGSKGLALAFDGFDPDPIARRAAGLNDYLDKYYQKHNNLKVLAINTQGSFMLVLRQPLTKDGDLKGFKIRGTTNYKGLVEWLGGSLVVLPISDTYAALERGVVDGAATAAQGMISLRWNEVTKYRMRPTFGAVTVPVFINLNRWNKLTKQEQSIMEEAGRQNELEVYWLVRQMQMKEEKELDRLGMSYQFLPAEKAAKIEAVYAQGIHELAEKCCGKEARELRKLAADAGLTDK
jgi:TRAP-type C4-dicarboxylate transport system substrate-binding protein